MSAGARDRDRRIVLGMDAELGNFITGLERRSGYEASRALLREIEGIDGTSPSAYPCDAVVVAAPRSRGAGRELAGTYQPGEGGGYHAGYPSGYGTGYSGGYGSGYGYGGGNGGGYADSDVRDWGRKFLPGNGGCVYIDLDHLELCLPEVTSAYDHVAYWHAMLRIARRAQVRAGRLLPAGLHLRVLANSSDGEGSAWGSHLNLLLTRRTWERIFERRLQYLLFLASYQASSIVFTGAGKVGAENRMPWTPYQLSQRADHFEQLCGVETTYRRPLVNARDESLCRDGQSPARGNGLARLHVIFYDNNLAHGSCLLKIGVLQLVCAMLEADRVDMGLVLDDPLDALWRWSHDPTLRARATTCAGAERTAVEHQLGFLAAAKAFVEAGHAEGVVPRAAEIVALWEDTLLKLAAGDLASLTGRLDWVLKWSLLERAMAQRSGLDWRDPELRHLDQIYASLEPGEGLYLACERSGLVERVASEAEIQRARREPPDDTRAWTRAMTLRRAEPAQIEAIDWDAVRFRFARGGWKQERRVLRMPDPRDFGRAHAGDALAGADADLETALERLGAESDAPRDAHPHDPSPTEEDGHGTARTAT